MSTITTKAKLKNGVLIPEKMPDFGIPDEVVVTFVKHEENGAAQKEGNALNILSLLDKYRGVLPRDFPEGRNYISDLRKDLAQEWEDRISS